MIILKKYNNEDIIKKLYKKHFNKKLMINDNIIYNLYDNNNIDRNSTRLNSSHVSESRMPSSA